LNDVDMKAVGLEALVYLVGKQANSSMTYLNERCDTWRELIWDLKSITAANPTAAPTQPSLGMLREYLSQLKSENAASDVDADAAIDVKIKAIDNVKAGDELVMWNAAADLITVQGQKLVDGNKDMQTKMVSEQKTILDAVKEVFLRAKAVNAALVGAP
jgi:hypothetical protein